MPREGQALLYLSDTNLGPAERNFHRAATVPAGVGDGRLRCGGGRLTPEQAVPDRANERPHGRGGGGGSGRRGLWRALRDPGGGRRVAGDWAQPDDGGSDRSGALREGYIEVYSPLPVSLPRLQRTRSHREEESDDARLRAGDPGARVRAPCGAACR